MSLSLFMIITPKEYIKPPDDYFNEEELKIYKIIYKYQKGSIVTLNNIDYIIRAWNVIEEDPLLDYIRTKLKAVDEDVYYNVLSKMSELENIEYMEAE